MQHIKIYYGPYESFNTMSHKPEKLFGLRDKLQKLGFRIEMVPVQYVNYCMLEMKGHEIFRCNIKNLMFYTPADQDPVCKRAIATVLNAAETFLGARNYFWLLDLLQEQLFLRGPYTHKDYWPFEFKPKPFASCTDCTKCCGIFVHSLFK